MLNKEKSLKDIIHAMKGISLKDVMHDLSENNELFRKKKNELQNEIEAELKRHPNLNILKEGQKNIDQFIEGYFSLLVPVLVSILEDKGLNLQEISGEELVTVLSDVLHQVNSKRIRILVRQDETEVLLTEALRYIENQNYYFACLMYFTWIEHMINRILVVKYTREKKSYDQIIAFIFNQENEDSTFKNRLNKLTINGDQKRKIRKLQEYRDNFVHYKWIPETLQSQTQYEEGVKKAVISFEETIDYMNNYFYEFLVSN